METSLNQLKTKKLVDQCDLRRDMFDIWRNLGIAVL